MKEAQPGEGGFQAVYGKEKVWKRFTDASPDFQRCLHKRWNFLMKSKSYLGLKTEIASGLRYPDEELGEFTTVHFIRFLKNPKDELLKIKSRARFKAAKIPFSKLHSKRPSLIERFAKSIAESELPRGLPKFPVWSIAQICKKITYCWQGHAITGGINQLGFSHKDEDAPRCDPENPHHIIWPQAQHYIENREKHLAEKLNEMKGKLGTAPFQAVNNLLYEERQVFFEDHNKASEGDFSFVRKNVADDSDARTVDDFGRERGMR
jgi:hypothetical protein